jgi:hypothetical protein
MVNLLSGKSFGQSAESYHAVAFLSKCAPAREQSESDMRV